MVDHLTHNRRSWNMSRIRSKDTAPELTVRTILHKMGYRFRLHRKDLPGKPDIVLPKHSSVVFVHGCFWHRHPGCINATTPASNQKYWLPKFKRTLERDRKNQIELSRLGWNVIVVWECELREPDLLANRLIEEITVPKRPYSQDLPSTLMAAETQETYRS